jgi:hypothetical protein
VLSSVEFALHTMCFMRGREPPSVPPESPGDPGAARPYAPETQLLPGVEPAAGDNEVLQVIRRLPDGSGPLERVGICNPSGTIYREVLLRGQVQLMYLWAGLNGLGFSQLQAADTGGYSKYRVLFGRSDREKRPHEGGRKLLPSG